MVTEPNQTFMQRAIKLSLDNVLSGTGGPFAAVIVRDGVIVGESANSVTATNDPTAHGEVNAIRNACTNLKTFSLQGCSIYSSCEPCPMCLAAIYWARIDKIFYGNTCDDAARAGFNDALLYEQFRLGRDARAIPSHQMLGAEAWTAFQAWLDSANRVTY